MQTISKRLTNVTRSFALLCSCVFFYSFGSAQDGSVTYRRPGSEYKSTISEALAKELKCVKIEPVEWEEYERTQETISEYNVPRTNVSRGHGEVETWTQFRWAAPQTLN